MGYRAKDLTFKQRAAQRASRFDGLLERWFAAKSSARELISEAPAWLASPATQGWRDTLDGMTLSGDTTAQNLERLLARVREYEAIMTVPALPFDRLISAKPVQQPVQFFAHVESALDWLITLRKLFELD